MANSISAGEKSTISIIIVTYNAAASIEATIKSIIEKKEFVNEVIIIDGGSTDGTLEIIHTYSDYISYWKSEADNGIYDAMNKGWEQANINNHILFLGAGDMIIELPNSLNIKPESIYFGEITIGNDKLFKAKVDLRLRIGNTIHHQALLIPKKIYPEPPFNIQYKVYADFDFNQRLLKRKVEFVKTNLLKAYVMPDGFSQHYETKEWYYIIKNNFGLHYAILGYLYHKYQLARKKTPNFN